MIMLSLFIGLMALLALHKDRSTACSYFGDYQIGEVPARCITYFER